MRKFILIMFIGLGLFAIDTCNISVSGTSNLYRLWSDTYIWIRGANDSLLILTDDNTSFDITAYDDISVLGVSGWDTTKTYYQTANIEADFANLETWDSLVTVLDSATAPDIKRDLSAITPAKLIRFLATAQDSVTDTTGATIKFQLLGLKR
jgi:hypothetical protein